MNFKTKQTLAFATARIESAGASPSPLRRGTWPQVASLERSGLTVAGGDPQRFGNEVIKASPIGAPKESKQK